MPRKRTKTRATARSSSTILFFAANAVEDRRLRLDEECRLIEERIRRAKFSDQIHFHSRWAARPDDLVQALCDFSPAVLHFGGHGEQNHALCFRSDDEGAIRVDASSFAGTLETAGTSILLLVLNACFTESQAQTFAAHVPCVIGMPGAIDDSAAISYAGALYRALASGRSVANAHRQAITELSNPPPCTGGRDVDVNNGAPRGGVPALIAQHGVDANDIYIVGAKRRCKLIIKATLEDFDEDDIARVTRELRRLTGDMSLQIIDIEEGSVKLTLSCSNAAVSQLLRLRDTGQLATIAGFKIEAIIRLREEASPASTAMAYDRAHAMETTPQDDRRQERMHEVAVSIDQYQVVRRIGAGGMGVVYEADDVERGQKVALKTISNPDIEKIYQLKREFRALAGLSHPNLVALYDLVVAADSCFFTMELLDGVDLLTYLWGRKAEDLAERISTPRTPSPTGFDDGDGADGEPSTLSSPRPTPCDLDRLRHALPQLARGLHALHIAGKIHRDVKPSNIQVTSDGRVVLLDFGMVAELEHRQAADGMLVGTIAYMAPEQCAGDVQLTAAADWYSLGVVLFQALTGRLPFEGVPTHVLYEKQTKIAPRPSLVVQHVPRDLDELCAELLERDPMDRPTGVRVLRWLGVVKLERVAAPVASLWHEGGFTGRDPELATLDATLEPLAVKRASVVLVRAPSGMGKTSLVQRFLERLRAREPNALVLHGRCLDREDVPYKAMDSLIDALSDWWLGLSPKQAQALLPRDAYLLPTLFPVLDRVPAIADAPRPQIIADPQARRTHAFGALRETLQRLGDRHTVVLFLDDMQWVDRDTTALLADIMRAPDPPAILLVLATRSEGSGPVVDLVRQMDGAQRLIDLGPLAADDALAVAVSHLGYDNRDTAEQLVREADGSPLFLIERARYLHGRSLEDVAGKGLDAMLAERIANLGDAGRMIAELVAVAGEPVTRSALTAISAEPPAELSRQLSLLRAQRVVRMSGSRAEDTIEPYHARVRAAVLRQLSDDRRARHHRALAIALSAKGTAEQLARHWYGAGNLEHAAGFARRAGDEAHARLDFDLSSRWYAIALEGPQWTDAERRALRSQLAGALSDAGRPREVAE